MDLTPYIGPTVTLVIALAGFYGMVSTRLARLESKLDGLADRVEKHNNVIERTYKLETEMVTAFKRIDELRESDKSILEKVEKGR